MKKVLPYIIITCLLSWLTVLIAYYAGLRINTMPYMIFGVFYMFLPAIVSIFYKNICIKKLLQNRYSFISVSINGSFWLYYYPLYYPYCLSL